VFGVSGKPVEMIERTGVRQRKMIDEHALAFEEPTKSHRNLPPYLHSLGASLEDWGSYRVSRMSSELTISLFSKALVFGIGSGSLLKP
jgi:hypothetical protein